MRAIVSSQEDRPSARNGFRLGSLEDAAEPVRREIEDVVTDAEPDARTVPVDREDAEAHRTVHADRMCLHVRVSMAE